MKYYFFKTVKDGSRNRLNPLPYQTSSDGTEIITKLNTQVAAGGMKLREAPSPEERAHMEPEAIPHGRGHHPPDGREDPFRPGGAQGGGISRG